MERWVDDHEVEGRDTPTGIRITRQHREGGMDVNQICTEWSKVCDVYCV